MVCVRLARAICERKGGILCHFCRKCNVNSGLRMLAWCVAPRFLRFVNTTNVAFCAHFLSKVQCGLCSLARSAEIFSPFFGLLGHAHRLIEGFLQFFLSPKSDPRRFFFRAALFESSYFYYFAFKFGPRRDFCLFIAHFERFQK